ncbi:MAG TPA: hypothetical protein VM846_06080, partial [Vicinamibacterales bacterium]|nr:hypothetical protein [Vicinamibacterales bacterium]
MRRIRNHVVAVVFVAIGVACVAVPAAAQYLRYPTTGVPRNADGTVNLSAPTPRAADGKPDFSGIWITGKPLCPNPDPVTYLCGAELPLSREGINFGIDMPGGLPYQPWLAALVKERTANDAKDDPHVRCLP